MSLDFDTYKEAFDNADQPFTLDKIIEDPEEFPEPLREALEAVEQEAVVAFYFLVYVEEVDNTINSWLPMKKEELIHQLDPDTFASQLAPVLKSAYARMMEAERTKEVSHGNGTPNSD